MTGLTRANLPLIIEIERIVRDADAGVLLDAVEVEDYTSVVQSFHRAIEQIGERIVEDSYSEPTQEQLLIADAVLRARSVLLLTDYLSDLLLNLARTESELFKQLDVVLFPDRDHLTDPKTD